MHGRKWKTAYKAQLEASVHNRAPKIAGRLIWRRGCYKQGYSHA